MCRYLNINKSIKNILKGVLLKSKFNLKIPELPDFYRIASVILTIISCYPWAVFFSYSDGRFFKASSYSFSRISLSFFLIFFLKTGFFMNFSA